MRWFKPPQGAASLRVAGDAARDKRDWAAAEVSYRAHLEGTPDDFDIWVQFGHSLKEQGKLGEAESAYRHAIGIKSENADVHLQLGHLLKRVGNLAGAAEAYGFSFRCDPSNDAYSELLALEHEGFAVELGGSTRGRTAANAVFIEIDDLLGYLETHKTLSGIQRVQAGVIQHVLAGSRPDEDRAYVFVLHPLDSDYLWGIRDSDLSELIEYVTAASVDHAHLKRMIARCRGHATAVTASAGDTYLILGAFWGYGGMAARYLRLKKAGVKIGVYIYDLIPITHTEYCDEGLPHEFALSLADGMAIFDFILTISEFTAREVKRYCTKAGLPHPPIKAVPLAHANSLASARNAAVWGPQIAHLRDRPFALMVSTIEARKNHGYLVAAWKQFLDEGLDPPDLVFVGRFGWRVASLMEMLETLHYLDGRIHIVHDLSDRDLDTLYASCLFTAFPSFVEGWGLPVGESLAHGKPCVASSTSSIPEVGGDLVDYLDPLNFRAGVEVIRKMAFDAKHRDRRSQQIVQGFALRDWREVGADLINQVDLLRQGLPSRQPPEVLFPQGTTFMPGQLALGRKLPGDYAARPLRLMLVSSWYGVETLGCWVRGSRASLSFRSDLPAGSRIVVYLQLYGTPQASEENTVSVSIGPHDPRGVKRGPGASPVRIPSSSALNVRTPGVVGEDGVVAVRLEIAGKIPRERNDPNGRQFVMGLRAIGYAAHSDVVARLDISDALSLN